MDGKGRRDVRVDDSQLPPQNNQSFHVTRYAHGRRPGPQCRFYGNRVRTCARVLRYAARGGTICSLVAGAMNCTNTRNWGMA